MFEHSLLAFAIDIYKVSREFYELFVKKFIFAISVDISKGYVRFAVSGNYAGSHIIFAILKIKIRGIRIAEQYNKTFSPAS